MNNKSFLVLLFLVISVPRLIAQITNTAFIDSVGGEKLGKLSISGWMDAYYAQNSNRTSTSKIIPNLVSSSNNNIIDINLAYLDFRYASNRTKLRIVPAFGSYMDKNYSRNATLANLMEASMAFKPLNNKDVWIEAGLIGSPFTNENPVSRDHIMYTRSLAAEYSPYYLTGLKVSAPLSPRIKGSFYVLNGWQTIYEEAEYPMGITAQLEFTLNDHHLINWNWYYQDRNTHQRIFSDIYWIGNWRKWKFSSCFYAGNDESKSPISSPKPNLVDRDGFWFNANFASSYSLTESSNISARIEFYRQLYHLVNGKVYSASVGYNRKIYDQVYWRTELKLLEIEDWRSKRRRTQMNGVTSLGFGF